MAQVLVLYFSLTRQTEQILETIVVALRSRGHEVTLEKLQPDPPYPFPAPPEMLGGLLLKALSGAWPTIPLRPIQADLSRRYDLVLLGYQPWYMTPSVPMHAFLKGPDARVLVNTPVIGIMTCRAMYGRATRLFRQWIEEQGGHVVEQRVFVDQDPRPSNMLSLGHYLRFGKDPEGGPLKRLLKPFGVGEAGRRRAHAYGTELANRLLQSRLVGNGEVQVLD